MAHRIAGRDESAPWLTLSKAMQEAADLVAAAEKGVSCCRFHGHRV
jgi:hypothetical protein